VPDTHPAPFTGIALTCHALNDIHDKEKKKMCKVKRLGLMIVFVMFLGLVLPAGSPGGPVLAEPTVPLRLYNIWATWCSPCVEEIPALGQIARDYAGRVEVIGLQYDALYYNGEQDPQAIQKGKDLFASSNATYTNLIPDDSHSAMLRGAEYLPTTYFTNRQGDIIDMVVGSCSYDSWASIIDQLLANLPEINPGDVNDDGIIDICDLIAMIDCILSGTSMPNADVNGDEVVDIHDLMWIIDWIIDG
jgi:thiol-disulfide isomerase/thioredoxin